MSNDELRLKWNQRYTDAADAALPIELLAEFSYLLPDRGDALDLACGRGGNALLLAKRGLDTRAWDISSVAIEQLQSRAADLPLSAEVRDVVALPPDPGSFDVICVGHFLDRPLCAHLIEALRPGGLLFYQTFSLERVDDSGPGDGPFRLQVNELLSLFAPLTVRFYRDEGRVGDTRRGFRNRAQLIAQCVD